MAKKPDHGSPFAGVDSYTLEDVGAIQAVYATPQGQRALTYIVEILAAYYDLSYRKDTHDTAFMEGRRFVGAQIVKLLKLNPQLLKDKHVRPSSRDPGRVPSAERKPGS